MRTFLLIKEVNGKKLAFNGFHWHGGMCEPIFVDITTGGSGFLLHSRQAVEEAYDDMTPEQSEGLKMIPIDV